MSEKKCFSLTLPPHPEPGQRQRQAEASESCSHLPTPVCLWSRLAPEPRSCEWELLRHWGGAWSLGTLERSRAGQEQAAGLKSRLPGSGVSLVTGAASLWSESGFYHTLQCIIQGPSRLCCVDFLNQRGSDAGSHPTSLAETLSHPSFPWTRVRHRGSCGKPSTVVPHGSTDTAVSRPSWTGRVGDPVAFTSDLGTSRETYGGSATPWKPALEDPLPCWPWKFLNALFLCPQPSFFPPRKAWQNPSRKPRVEVVFLYLLLSGNAWLPSE